VLGLLYSFSLLGRSAILSHCVPIIQPSVHPHAHFFFTQCPLATPHQYLYCMLQNEPFHCSACCVLSFILFYFFFHYLFTLTLACCMLHSTHALFWSSGSLNQARVGVTASRMRMPTHCSVLASHGYATLGAFRSYMNHRGLYP
jgi:hypothetical protein